jgi:hypothetical protein
MGCDLACPASGCEAALGSAVVRFPAGTPPMAELGAGYANADALEGLLDVATMDSGRDFPRESRRL